MVLLAAMVPSAIVFGLLIRTRLLSFPVSDSDLEVIADAWEP